MTRTAKYFGFGRTKKIIAAFVALLAAVMLIVPITDSRAFAESAGTKDLDAALLPYAQELEKLNEELGTDFAFVSRDDFTDEQNDYYTNFYLQMTLEEFRDYICEVFKDDIDALANPNLISNQMISKEKSDNAEALAVNPTEEVTQRYFYNYSRNKNYVSITSEIMYGDGRAYYLDTLYPNFYAEDITDFYTVDNFSCEFNSDRTSMFVSFYCTHFVDRLESKTTLSARFTAGGGDVYKK